MERRKALVLYGSETGNSQDVAEELGRMTERLHFASHVAHLDAVDPVVMAQYNLTLVAVSTTGQGELPNNSRLFWKKLLRRKLPPTHLKDVTFTSFGLGDSSYPKYNWAARKLHKRLKQLGAFELYQQGEGDEQHPEGHESALTVWSDGLRQRILDIFPLEIGIEPIAANVLLPPKWTLGIENQHTGDQEKFRNCTKEVLDAAKSQISQSSGSIHIKNGHVQQPQDTGQYLDALLETTHRVTAKHHWQDVRHMTFSTVTQASYQPGDVLTIYPKNDPHDVDKVLSLMRWVDVADERLELIPTQATNSSLECHVASPFGHLQEHGMTLRTLLTSHLDLNAIPRRSFFSLISHFTEDEFQKNRLLEFINPEFIDELYDYTTRPRRSVVEVLQEFDTVKIPWQWATNVFPELRGRQFSITSGGQLKGGEGKNARFELLVAIVKYKTVIKKIREGVCTRYLAGLNPGYSLRVSLHKGGLAITKAEASQPVVLIGPGTGVAPMRSLIWERYLWDNQLNANTDTKDISRQGISSKIGESVLFFGCRSREADYFFQDEWEDLKSKMPLQVFVAFSRDQKQKVYVQDLIRQQSSLVYRLLHEENGIVYICGSSGKMPQAVREALIEVFQTGKGNDREVAEAYLLTMEKQGRYKQETW